MRGTATFQVDGKTYTLRFDWNALCAIEAATGQKYRDVLAKCGGKDAEAGALRATLWAGLRKHHPDLTLEGAGDLLSIETIPGIVEALNKATEAASPGGDDRPSKAVSSGKNS